MAIRMAIRFMGMSVTDSRAVNKGSAIKLIIKLIHSSRVGQTFQSVGSDRNGDKNGNPFHGHERDRFPRGQQGERDQTYYQTYSQLPCRANFPVRRFRSEWR